MLEHRVATIEGTAQDKEANRAEIEALAHSAHLRSLTELSPP